MIQLFTCLFAVLALSTSAFATNVADPISDFQRYLESHPDKDGKDVCKKLRSYKSDLLPMFSQGATQSSPKGDTYGCVISMPNLPDLINGPLAVILNFAWTGKTFNNEGTGLVNKVLKIDLATAEVYPSKSVLDQKDVIVLDYSHSSKNLPGTTWLISSIRDEIRQVANGIYLGRVFLKTGTEEGKPTYYDPEFYFAVFTAESGLNN